MSASVGKIANITGRLLLRAGWAPVLVFLLHAIFSRVVLVYRFYGQSDVPMHFFGGVAIAYFFSACFAVLPPDAVSPKLRPIAQFVLVVSLTATAAVFWELGEFTSDWLLGTKALDDVYDTLQDMAIGISGGLAFTLIAWWRGKIGEVQPL